MACLGFYVWPFTVGETGSSKPRSIGADTKMGKQERPKVVLSLFFPFQCGS